MNERLIAAHLPHDDVVFLSEFITLMNIAPNEYGNEQY